MATHGRNVRKKRTTVAELETFMCAMRNVIELHSREIGKLNAERQAAKVADFTARQSAQAQMPQVTIGSVFDVKATGKIAEQWAECVNNKNKSDEVSRRQTDNLYSAVREGLEVMTGIDLIRTSDYGFTVVVKWMVPTNIFVRVNTQTKQIFVTFRDRGDNERESNHWHTTHAVAKIVAVAMFYARSNR